MQAVIQVYSLPVFAIVLPLIMRKKITRFIIRFIVTCFVLLIVALFIFDRLVQFRMDDAELTQYFAQKHQQVNIGYYATHNRTIRYARAGADTTATLFFIHGAPSSLSYFKDYMTDSTLLQHATMYAVDRPGYGYSGLAKPIPFIDQQAAMIKPVIDSLHKVHHPVILVAASFGTAIACRLAMDNPGLVDGIVLMAPAIAPGEERVFWFSPAIETPLLNWTVPRMLQSANTEKLHHKEELTKMLPLWQKIRVPVIYLQGDKDELVYTTNAGFARKQLVNAPFVEINMIPGRGHLIAFSERKLVTEKIMKMIEMTEKK